MRKKLRHKDYKMVMALNIIKNVHNYGYKKSVVRKVLRNFFLVILTGIVKDERRKFYVMR